VRYEPDDTGCQVSIVVSGQAVAILKALRLTMHLRGAPLPMAGIADVRTHPAHRRHGHARRLFDATLAYMRQERYPVTLLFGISDFYWRFGYTPVLPEYEVSLPTPHAERLSASLPTPEGATVRPARPTDIPDLLDLYARASAGRTGTLQRQPSRFELEVKPDVESWWFHPRRYLLAEVGGRPAGYAVLSGDPSTFRVREIAVPEEHLTRAGPALLATLVEEAVRRRLERIRLPLPPDEPLLDLLRPLGCRVEITYPANSGGMGRLIDLQALAEALTPALAAQVAALPPQSRPGSLELVALADDARAEPEARATLRWGPGRGAGGGAGSAPPETRSRLSEWGDADPAEDSSQLAGRAVRVALPPQGLCQLLMGYRGIDELRLHHPGAVTPDDLPTVRALLPAGFPHMWALDHF
jgi:predicted N-acetyltransferase YhbS